MYWSPRIKRGIFIFGQYLTILAIVDNGRSDPWLRGDKGQQVLTPMHF
jgi:hypothetical protein